MSINSYFHPFFTLKEPPTSNRALSFLKRFSAPILKLTDPDLHKLTASANQLNVLASLQSGKQIISTNETALFDFLQPRQWCAAGISVLILPPNEIAHPLFINAVKTHPTYCHEINQELDQENLIFNENPMLSFFEKDEFIFKIVSSANFQQLRYAASINRVYLKAFNDLFTAFETSPDTVISQLTGETIHGFLSISNNEIDATIGTLKSCEAYNEFISFLRKLVKHEINEFEIESEIKEFEFGNSSIANAQATLAKSMALYPNQRVLQAAQQTQLSIVKAKFSLEETIDWLEKLSQYLAAPKANESLFLEKINAHVSEDAEIRRDFGKKLQKIGILLLAITVGITLFSGGVLLPLVAIALSVQLSIAISGYLIEQSTIQSPVHAAALNLHYQLT